MWMKAFLSIFMMVFVAGCATAPKPPVVPVQQDTVQGLCRKYNMDCRWDGVTQSVSMNYGGKKIRAMAGSNIVMVNDQKIALSGALVSRRGAVVIPPDFERVIIGPAAKPQEDFQKGASSGRLRRVVVDAGHGGKDPGALGYAGVREEDVVLDLARRLAKDFEDAGIQTLLTRNKDEFITLQDRTLIASKPDVDLFISIHANAHKSKRSCGIEIYYSPPLNHEDKEEAQRSKNEKKIVSLYNMRSDDEELREIVSDMLYAHKLSVSPGLADAVSRGLQRETDTPIRGTKPERFSVLRSALVPAILVEVGFITNPKEAMSLQKKEYRQKIADAITKSVLRFYYDSGK